MYVHLSGASCCVKVSDWVQLDQGPLAFGDTVIKVGQFIERIGRDGDKVVTTTALFDPVTPGQFVLNDGGYFRYAGKADEFILFAVNDSPAEEYYGFVYKDRHNLFVPTKRGGWDVRIEQLDVIDELPGDTVKY